MLLHAAVGINCKKGATTENQGAGVTTTVSGVNYQLPAIMLEKYPNGQLLVAVDQT